jgi:hypothetical protein
MFIYEAELLLMCHLRRTDFLKQFYQSSEQSIMNPQQEVQATLVEKGALVAVGNCH